MCKKKCTMSQPLINPLTVPKIEEIYIWNCSLAVFTLPAFPFLASWICTVSKEPLRRNFLLWLLYKSPILMRSFCDRSRRKEPTESLKCSVTIWQRTKVARCVFVALYLNQFLHIEHSPQCPSSLMRSSWKRLSAYNALWKIKCEITLDYFATSHLKTYQLHWAAECWTKLKRILSCKTENIHWAWMRSSFLLLIS